jgi:hypothetical protein
MEDRMMTTRRGGTLSEARTAHRNLSVQHPNRWRLIAELLFSPPTHFQRYRDLNRKMVEDVIERINVEAGCR